MTLRVLVADDNKDLADSLAMLLRGKAFRCRSAYGGQQAIEAAMSFQPDVLILDMVMPLTDGIQVANQLRPMPQFASKLFIALSGYSEQKLLDRASMARFDEFLIKPFKRDMLMDILVDHASQLGSA